MIKNKLLVLSVVGTLIFMLQQCVPVTPTASSTTPINKKIEFRDKVYEKFIKTVRLFPNLNTVNQDIQTPIVNLYRNPGLTLEFDALLDDYLTLQAKLVHCNANWTPSRLADIEFLSEYNAFDLNTFDYSQNTKTLYVNYRFQVPPTKVSGNYLLIVYQNNNKDDVVLTRRFAVFEDKVAIDQTIGLSSGVLSRDMNQQIEFSINYKGLEISNPLTDVYVVVRQNQRWDNAILGLKPTQIRDDLSEMEYRHFNMENNFLGGNEFRFVDLRQYSFRGQNVAFLNKDTTPISAQVVTDKTRALQVYAQFRDLNGGYFIETKEPGASYLETDYMKVKFKLSAPQPIDQPVYLLGAFNGWDKSPRHRMTYDATLHEYSINLLMKQGFYNYIYHTGNDNENAYTFEGSFYQTENQYDIFVYFKPLGSFTERLVGYRSFATEF